MDLSRLDELNDNKFFQGALFLLYIIGSKEVFEEPVKNLRHILKMPLIKYFVVFCAAFVVTKNIRESMIITLGYIVLFGYLLYPGSGVSLISMPKKKNELIDTRPIHTQLEHVPSPPRNEVSKLMQHEEPEDKLNQFFQPMSLELESPY